MANRQIYQLTSNPGPTTDFVIPVQEASGATEAKKTTLAELKTQLGLNTEAFAGLSDGGPVFMNWNVATIKKAAVTLSGNRILILTGSVDGDSGALKVTQGGAGSFTLTLPGEPPVGYALSTGVGHVDLLEWNNIDGILFWKITNYGAVAAADVTAPALVDIEATASGTLIVTYNETVNPNTVDPANFVLKVNTVVKSVNNLFSLSATEIQLGVTSVVMTSGDTITLSYVSGPGRIADLSGNLAASYTDHAVINSIP